MEPRQTTVCILSFRVILWNQPLSRLLEGRRHRIVRPLLHSILYIIADTRMIFTKFHLFLARSVIDYTILWLNLEYTKATSLFCVIYWLIFRLFNNIVSTERSSKAKWVCKKLTNEGRVRILHEKDMFIPRSRNDQEENLVRIFG